MGQVRKFDDISHTRGTEPTSGTSGNSTPVARRGRTHTLTHAYTCTLYILYTLRVNLHAALDRSECYIREVSWFQGLWCTQMGCLGQPNEPCLSRYPHCVMYPNRVLGTAKCPWRVSSLRVPWIEGYGYRVPLYANKGITISFFEEQSCLDHQITEYMS